MGSSVQLSRWLGPSGRGQIAAAMLWPMLLMYIMSMGLISAIMYYAAQPETPIQELMANAAGCALACIIHVVEGAKSLLCYKHVVKTVFEATKEASA